MANPDAPAAKKRKSTKETTTDTSNTNNEPVSRKCRAKISLLASGKEASLEQNTDERVPITLTDVQHLLLHVVLGDQSPYCPPRWYRIEKIKSLGNCVCLVIENVSVDHFTQNIECFKYTNILFQEKVEMITPAAYGGSLVDELAHVPVTQSDKELLIKQYGSIETALESRKDLMMMLKAVFPVEDGAGCIPDGVVVEDKFPRTQLLLSASQMIDEGYPLPLKGRLKNIYSDYVLTKAKYEPVTPKSPMFGLDCEMCLTQLGNELTRVSVVNEKHECVYESFVKPFNNIINYLTQYSGITQAMLQNVTKRLEDVREELRTFLPPDAILVGQSLNFDLHAMRLMHPYIIDTSVIFNITGERRRKTKLKTLTKEFLKQDIQMSATDGHCSVEDSKASLKLVQLKLSKSVSFGDAVQEKQRIEATKQQRDLAKPQLTTSIFGHIGKEKMSLIIGCEDMVGDYYDFINRVNSSNIFSGKRKRNKVSLMTEETQDQTVEKVCEMSKDQSFILSHLKIKKKECINEKYQQIDEWVAKIHNSLQPGAFFLLVFGGSKEANGVAMMKIKKNS